MNRTDVLIAFIGKQDPFTRTGEEGPLLSAIQQLSPKFGAALLLFAEGGSDRADNRRDDLAEGTQNLRTEEVRAALEARLPGIEVLAVELGANPSHQEDLWRAFRLHQEVRALRQRWQGHVAPHVLTSGGTPAMREVLSTLAVTSYFGDTTNWYAPDRGPLRKEYPLAVQSVYLSSMIAAVRLGEYALAAEQLKGVGHEDKEHVRPLLGALQAYADGAYSRGLKLLQGWNAPELLRPWMASAVTALRLLQSPEGRLMALWNEVDVASPRNTVLAYATLLETALQTLLRVNKLPGQDDSAGAMFNRLRSKISVPEVLDPGAEPQRRLYNLRSDVIHSSASVSREQQETARQAATDLLRTFPASSPDTEAFLKAPHRNAFSLDSRRKLADLMHAWLTG